MSFAGVQIMKALTSSRFVVLFEQPATQDAANKSQDKCFAECAQVTHTKGFTNQA